MDRIARALATLAAPVLPFTAEEIWSELPAPKEESVHLARFETLSEFSEDPASAPAWERLTKLREEVAAVLEEARREKVIGSSLEGAVALTADEALRGRPRGDRHGGRGSPTSSSFRRSRRPRGPRLPGKKGGSRPRPIPASSLRFHKAPGRRCDRCWKVTPEAEDTGLCERCRRVLASLPASVVGGAA